MSNLSKIKARQLYRMLNRDKITVRKGSNKIVTKSIRQISDIS